MRSEPAPLSVRDKVYLLETQMLRDFEQQELPVRHFFSPGVYARELFIPKGVTLTGKIHKYPQLNIMSAGVLWVLVDEDVVRVEAPFTIVSPAGTKRVAYALEDTVWTTLHGTEERDLARIEEHFIAQTEEEYLAFVEQQRIEAEGVAAWLG